ncbi:MAG: hypothetical protein JW910_15735 [Anaerolineae bacterium]|nr:hypothetical protein [Anaerolineae bacterium]
MDSRIAVSGDTLKRLKLFGQASSARTHDEALNKLLDLVLELGGEERLRAYRAVYEAQRRAKQLERDETPGNHEGQPVTQMALT